MDAVEGLEVVRGLVRVGIVDRVVRGVERDARAGGGRIRDEDERARVCLELLDDGGTRLALRHGSVDHERTMPRQRRDDLRDAGSVARPDQDLSPLAHKPFDETHKRRELRRLVREERVDHLGDGANLKQGRPQLEVGRQMPLESRVVEFAQLDDHLVPRLFVEIPLMPLQLDANDLEVLFGDVLKNILFQPSDGHGSRPQDLRDAFAVFVFGLALREHRKRESVVRQINLADDIIRRTRRGRSAQDEASSARRAQLGEKLRPQCGRVLRVIRFVGDQQGLSLPRHGLQQDKDIRHALVVDDQDVVAALHNGPLLLRRPFGNSDGIPLAQEPANVLQPSSQHTFRRHDDRLLDGSPAHEDVERRKRAPRRPRGRASRSAPLRTPSSPRRWWRRQRAKEMANSAVIS